MFRRHLVIVKSKLYVGGVILLDPLLEKSVHSFGSHDACARWCRQNGWSADWDSSGTFSKWV